MSDERDTGQVTNDGAGSLSFTQTNAPLAGLIPTIADEIALLLRLGTAPRTVDAVIASMDRSAYILLRKLDAEGSLPITALAEEFQLDISTVSRQVSSMETNGFVERFPDKENGRMSQLQITELGRSRLYEVRTARYKLFENILLEWSDEELGSLAKSLSHFNRDMKRWRKKQV